MGEEGLVKVDDAALQTKLISMESTEAALIEKVTALTGKVDEVTAKVDKITAIQMPDDVKQKFKEVLTWVIANL